MTNLLQISYTIGEFIIVEQTHSKTKNFKYEITFALARLMSNSRNERTHKTEKINLGFETMTVAKGTSSFSLQLVKRSTCNGHRRKYSPDVRFHKITDVVLCQTHKIFASPETDKKSQLYEYCNDPKDADFSHLSNSRTIDITCTSSSMDSQRFIWQQK